MSLGKRRAQQKHSGKRDCPEHAHCRSSRASRQERREAEGQAPNGTQGPSPGGSSDGGMVKKFKGIQTPSELVQACPYNPQVKSNVVVI